MQEKTKIQEPYIESTRENFWGFIIRQRAKVFLFLHRLILSKFYQFNKFKKTVGKETGRSNKSIPTLLKFSVETHQLNDVKHVLIVSNNSQREEKEISARKLLGT
jgi:hypothetical protein